MTEQSKADEYIKCSKCRCKHINDDEHIKKDFGYNRLEQRFKTCVKCRDKGNEYKNSPKGIEASKRYYESKGRQYNFEKVVCGSCGASVCRNALRSHERQNGCSKN